MTIKFEREPLNPPSNGYYYRIFEGSYHGSLGQKVSMMDYEFETLFKDMAKELGYNVEKKDKPSSCLGGETDWNKVSNIAVEYNKISSTPVAFNGERWVPVQTFDKEKQDELINKLIKHVDNLYECIGIQLSANKSIDDMWTSQIALNEGINERLEKLENQDK